MTGNEPAQGFSIRFRSTLSRADIAVLTEELNLAPVGQFWNYFNPYRGGQARGVTSMHGKITLSLEAVGAPPDVYLIHAFPTEGVSGPEIVALKTKVMAVVQRIADTLEPPPGAVLHYFVRHHGRPAGKLYRLRTDKVLAFELWSRSIWVDATAHAWWVLSGRSAIGVSDEQAARIAAELDREFEADSKEEIYDPVLDFLAPGKTGSV